MAVSLKKKRTIHMLCEGAVMVALAMILTLITVWEMPWGGSIRLAMLPIILFACRWGVGPGLVGGLAYGTLHFLLKGGFVLGWQSILGDYLIAYTVVGLAGLFHGKKSSVFWGTLVGGGARFLVHYVVGATVWAEYMPEEFFGLTMTTPWFYSLLYNGPYMAASMALCALAFALLMPAMKQYLTAQDLK